MEIRADLWKIVSSNVLSAHVNQCKIIPSFDRASFDRVTYCIALLETITSYAKVHVGIQLDLCKILSSNVLSHDRRIVRASTHGCTDPKIHTDNIMYVALSYFDGTPLNHCLALLDKIIS